ncbi:MAG: hypothetical protein L3J16_02535 [Anaerolineales bacterium]|nr:hypothetical protein [Anaerolineales bacterium]
MQEKDKAGTAIALIGAILGIFVIYASFLQVYDPIMASEMAVGRAGGASIESGISVSKYVMPIVNDITLVGGVMWTVAAYGFMHKEKWAWSTAVTANVLSLLSFFMLIPAMSRGISPVYTIVFVPNIIAFFLLLRHVRQIDPKIVVLSTVAGMAYVMSFMNGVAATDQMLSGGKQVFIIAQRLSWLAAIAWATFVIGLLNRKNWSIQIGLGAALLTLVAGIPAGVAVSLEASKFSMYLLAPILALLLKISLVHPKSNALITQWLKRKEPIA